MLRVILCVAVFASGCAPEPAARTVRTVIKTRQCTTTAAAINKDEFCALSNKRNCPQIVTCGEAYYRYTTCGHTWLDGGTAVPRDGQPNGIPCENMCGKDAMLMAGKIRSEPPFSPPTQTMTVCNPV